jgi:hypothetical protein
VRLILLTVAVAIGIGVLAGGNFRFFPSIGVRWWWLAIAGVVLQVVPVSGELGYVALLASFALLLAFALMNLRSPGFILILVGLLLNAVVIAANHGMPVTQRALTRSGQAATLADLIASGGAKHHLAKPDTVLLALGDVIALPQPIGQAVSAGDLCVHLGVGWFVVAALRPRRPITV